MSVAIFLVVLTLGQAETSPEALIEQGVELRKAGQDLDALKKFEAAYALSQGSRALAQIALAEQALGRWVDAERHLSEALANTEDPWINRNRRALEGGLSTIRERLVSIEILASVEGARIRVNGRDAGLHPLPRPVHAVAGTVIVEVSAKGYWTLSRRLSLEAGEIARESFTLVPRTPVPSTPPAPKAAPEPAMAEVAMSQELQPGTDLRPFAWTAAGTAVAAAGLGTAFMIVRAGHINDYNDDSVCLAGGRTRDQNCGESLDSANSAEVVSIIGFVAAGVLGGTAALLFALDGSGRGEGQARNPTKPPLGPLAYCSLGPGALGLGCSLRF